MQSSRRTAKFLRQVTAISSPAIAPIIAIAAFAISGTAFQCTARAETEASLGTSDFTLEQETYTDTSGSTVSGGGMLILDGPQMQADGFTAGGYINIHDADGWVGQNIPVVNNSGAVAIKLDLGTADGVVDPTDNVSVDYTAAPVTSGTPNFTADQNYNLGQIGQNPDGDGGTPENTAGAPDSEGTAGKPAKPVVTVLPFNDNGVTKGIYQPGYANVQAAGNQCGPAAGANNLAYIAGKGMVKVTDANAPGRYSGGVLIARPGQTPNESAAGPNETSLVAQLDKTMARNTGTSRGDVANSGGVTGPNFITGMEQYLSNAGNAGNLVEENNLPAQANINGVNNTSVGGNVADFLYNELNKGAAVSMQYDWATKFAAGQPATKVINFNGNNYTVWFTGSHWVDILGAGSVKGVPYAFFDSDLAQTNVDANDNKYNTSTINLPLLGNLNAYDIPSFSWLYTNNYTPGWNSAGYSLSYESNFNYLENAIAVLPEPGSLALLALCAAPMLRRRRI